MTLSLKIDSVDLVGYLERDSLSIEQDASSYAATCSFNLIDEAGSLSLSETDEVLIEDGDVLFHGEIAAADDEQITINNTTARKWIVRCQDDQIKLENVVVEIAAWDDLVASDIEMIDDLFDAYYSSGIDYSTYVVGTPLEPAMTEMAFEGVTLREAISQIAARSGGKFYVHYEGSTLYFHYFDSESNVAAFGLSDDPDYGDTFPYNEIHVADDATQLVNAVYLVGKDTAKWVTDATSISAYGRREATVSDPNLLTEAALDDFGAQFIAEHKYPKTTYRVVTAYGAGLRAGMQIALECTAKSIDATLNINRLRIYYIEDTPYWELELGDTPPDFVASGRSLNDQVSAISAQITVVQNDIFDDEAPSAPVFEGGNLTTGVTIDADGHQIVYIRATWGSVADSDLNHYEVQLADNDAFNWPNEGRIAADGTREYQWNGLKGNTSYYARVRSVDWVGNYSAWSPADPGYLTVTSSKDSSAPGTPTGLAAAGARTIIGVSWNQNAEADLSYYELQRSTAEAGVYATVYTGKAAFYVDNNHTEAAIAAGTTYWYKVRAVDTSGNASSYTAVTSASLSQIGSDTIAANAIIAAKIAAGAVETAKLAAGAVDTDQLAADAVTAAKIDVSQLSAITADMGTLTAGEIRVGTGTVGSNFTGFRIMSSYLGGYYNDTLQAGIRVSDGKFIAGGGTSIADVNGFSVIVTTSFNAVRSYRFDNGSGTTIARLWCYDNGSSLCITQLIMPSVASRSAQIWLDANAPSGKGATIYINTSYDSGSKQSYIILTANASAASLEYNGQLKAARNSTTYDAYAFVPLTTELTSTSWDGDARSTTSKTVIDLSSVFGAPAGIEAVKLVTMIRDSGAAGTECWTILGPNSTAYIGSLFSYCYPAADRWNGESSCISCDANGDIYFQIGASGSSTFDMHIQIWGYYI